jgi:adenylylsulfate kinase
MGEPPFSHPIKRERLHVLAFWFRTQFLLKMPSQNIFPVNDRLVARKERASSFGHKGGVFWLCGLSGSGKSTLAISLERFLFEKKYQTIVLDGDNLRDGLCNDLGFSMSDRTENVRRVSETAKLIARNGYIVIVSLISPTTELRSLAKEIIGEEDFFEIFIKSTFTKCHERDVKGLYADSESGNLKSFTGKDSIFEDPTNPWMVIDTENETVTNSVTKICDAVFKQCSNQDS